jgi:hypothetical protein
MKKLLLFSLLASISAGAQITLTQSQFPGTGVTFHMNMADTAGVLPGNSGTNVTWNFTSLNSAVGTMTDSFLVVNATPYGAMYPQANLVKHETGPGIDYFVYYNTSSSFASRVGNADTVNQITYSDPVNEFAFPETYGSNSSDTYYAVYTDQSSSSVVHVHGTTTTTADGTGTLQLPSGTYTNTLRVHYTRDELDTVFTSSGNLADHLLTNYYLWYIAGTYYPILNIQTTFIDLGFSQYYRKYVGWRTPPLGIASIDPAAEQLNVFPNPASADFHIACPAEGTVEIYSVDGKLLREEKVAPGELLTLSPGTFEPGPLLIVFRNDAMVLRKQLLITR